ncbi:MAG: metal-sensitive transcriptional regulator [Moraxellaceae bacterium]
MKPSTEQKAEMLKRLARVEGQLRGVQKLIDGDADCEKVLQQMTASRKALDRAFFEMMACLIESSVVNESERDMPARMADIRELLSKYA